MRNNSSMHSHRLIPERDIVSLGADLTILSSLTEWAKFLQEVGMQCKLAGDHKEAVRIYTQLLAVVRVMDNVRTFSWPQGLSTQLVQRAIELEEENGQCQYASPSQFPPSIQ